jgi:hypothetical protein
MRHQDQAEDKLDREYLNPSAPLLLHDLFFFLGPLVGIQATCKPFPWAIGGAHGREQTDLKQFRPGQLIGHSHKDSLRRKLSQAISITTHSGVGYYAPAARTTLNPCVFLCSSFSTG